MKKLITSIILSSFALIAFGQMTELWNFSVTRTNQTAVVDDIKNGIAVSNDGTQLFLSTRANGSNQVAVYNPTTGARTGYLPALASFASTYGGDVVVDGNGAIYASNVIISASALMVAKWDNATATPTLFITTTAHGGGSANRIGYGMGVFVDVNGDGFLLMHRNASAEIKYWQIENNVPVSQNPATISVTATPAVTDSYARIHIVDKNHFWLDGSVTLPNYCTITRGTDDYSTPTSISGTRISTRSDINTGVGGATEFALNGKRYGIFAANNHSAVAPWDTRPGHYSLFQELATAQSVSGSVIASFSTDGLGKTTDASHFVESVVHIGEDCAYIYSNGGLNGVAAFRVDAVKMPVFTPAAGTHAGSSLNVTVSSATEGAEIRYTIDGSTPTASSTLYVDGISLPAGETTVKLLAVKSGLLSTITQATYVIEAPSKTFTVTVPQGTEKVYVAGSFTFKNWDNTTPYELTATANPNEFTGTFACEDGVEYKYLNGKGNWDYQEASSLGSSEFNAIDASPTKPSDGANRSYNASDNVANWKAVPKLVLKTDIAIGGVPTNLFVKGGWDGWATAVELPKNGTHDFTVTIGDGIDDVYYSNTGYKYYTTDLGSPENWESRVGGNRWAIYPSMTDEINGFETSIPITGLDGNSVGVRITRTLDGITVKFSGTATIELYNMNGVLVDKTITTDSYTRELSKGMYIIRVNGQAQKFVR